VPDTLPTVVLVDDAVEVRTLVRTQLRLSQRFEVVGEGGDGVEAVELARVHQPALVLLDVSMPRLDGLGALAGIREVAPGTRVVMYSGFDERGLAERAVEMGAAGFVDKATDIERLADELAAVLGDELPARAPHPEPGADDSAAAAGGTRVLTEHLERFREVFEEAAIGMATMTLTGYVVRANAALAALVGRQTEDIVGASYVDLVAPEDVDGVRRVVSSIDVAGPDVVRLEHGVAGGRGRQRLLATFAPVRDSRRRPLYLFLQAQDVTAQRQAEEDLRQSEERFRLLVEAVEDYGIFMLDPTGHVASWNAGAERIKGYSAADIIGQHFRVFYPPQLQQIRHPEHELELALEHGHYEEEGWRIRKDGSRFWANVVITALRNPAGEHVGFTKVTRDITERRQILEERERAAAQQADFLAVTAHELRGPVGLLGGSAVTLAEHWSELTSDERSDMLRAMVKASARLRRLLGDLLTASRLQVGAMELHREVVDIGSVLRTVASSSRHTTTVTVTCPNGIDVVADADRLSQAVENLVGNAAEHGAPPVRIDVTTGDSAAYISVTDSGAGVGDEVRPRLFERFSTGRRAGGTGLGLFIVRELSRAQGGDAWYDAAWGGPGARFVISLPLAVGRAGG
jgi:PAS domain S-box-containing protein